MTNRGLVTPIMMGFALLLVGSSAEANPCRYNVAEATIRISNDDQWEHFWKLLNRFSEGKFAVLNLDEPSTATHMHRSLRPADGKYSGLIEINYESDQEVFSAKVRECRTLKYQPYWNVLVKFLQAFAVSHSTPAPRVRKYTEVRDY